MIACLTVLLVVKKIINIQFDPLIVLISPQYCIDRGKKPDRMRWYT